MTVAAAAAFAMGSIAVGGTVAAQEAPVECEWPYVFPPQPRDCELSEEPSEEPSDEPSEADEPQPAPSQDGIQEPPPRTSTTPPVEPSEADDPTPASTAPSPSPTSRSETRIEDDASSQTPSMGTGDDPTDRFVQPVVAPDPPVPDLEPGTDPSTDRMILVVVLFAVVLGGVSLASLVKGGLRPQL